MADKEDLIKSAQESIDIENQEPQNSTDAEQNNSEIDFNLSFKPGEIKERSIVDEMNPTTLITPCPL